jgi:hypothetical protein
MNISTIINPNFRVTANQNQKQADAKPVTKRLRPWATTSLFLGVLVFALFSPAAINESYAQSRHMKQDYNPHNRKMNRGHDQKQKAKTWKQKRNSEDPRYKKHWSGGNPHEHKARHQANATAGGDWRITSDCASACTTGFAAYPKARICIAEGVRLGFHHGVTADRTAAMWTSYPGDVKALIQRHGGWRPEWTWVPAAAFHAAGYRLC